MAEFLVRTVDKTLPDAADDATQTKRGDVIVVADDGHTWGDREKDKAFWRIVSVPAMTLSEAREWTAEQVGTPPWRHKRAFKLDIDNLPNGIKNSMNNPRNPASEPIVIPLQTMRDNKATKTPQSPP